jgi:hypothetical protein
VGECLGRRFPKLCANSNRGLVWFWAAYLMTTDKRGVSALLLQRQLALPRYETAWMMLHKFRRAMINLAREPLRGEVEVETGPRHWARSHGGHPGFQKRHSGHIP